MHWQDAERITRLEREVERIQTLSIVALITGILSAIISAVLVAWIITI